MTSRSKSILLLMIFYICIIGGCARVSVPVDLIRPAEVNLSGKNIVQLAPFSGRGGLEVQSYVRTILADSDTIRLVSSEHSPPVSEYVTAISQGESTTPVIIPEWKKMEMTKPEPAKESEALVLIKADMLDYEYTENVYQRNFICRRRVIATGKGYVTEFDDCTHFVRKGRAGVRVAFEAVDIKTGETIAAKTPECRMSRYTEEIDGFPASLDGRAMLDRCAQKVAQDFCRVIIPWSETVKVNLYKHNLLPMLEEGIEYAKAGLWPEAVGLFEQAVEIAAADPAIDKTASARANWNLGIGYLYTERFDEAEIQVKKAYELDGRKEYIEEVKNIKNRREEKKKLSEQLSNNSKNTDLKKKGE